MIKVKIYRFYKVARYVDIFLLNNYYLAATYFTTSRKSMVKHKVKFILLQYFTYEK